jgi:hypothetical protein
MPGLFGVASADPNQSLLDSSSMLSELTYGRAVVKERFSCSGVDLGCVHVGTGGQRALYESTQAVVLFFGYLTCPPIPPGADPGDPAAAAHHVHDAYLSRGLAFLPEISGAFSFALWDVQARVLMLVSDRLGLRPLYYAEHAGTFRFASEVKGILADPQLPRRLDHAAAADLFQNNFIMGGKTLFEDIHVLPPGSVLRYQEGRQTLSQYWDIAFPSEYPKRPDRYYDDLIFEALRAAVRRPGLSLDCRSPGRGAC